MDNLLKHIENLKNFDLTSDEYYGMNKMYFLQVKEKAGMTKVGDTHRDVKTRNDETLTNASLHREQVVSALAVKEDGSTFRDKQFHKWLEDRGYKRELNDNGSKSEWFFITMEQVLAEFAEFTKLPVKKLVELRVAQMYVLEELKKATEEGAKYINLGACVRIGKTIISLTHAKNNNCMPIYIGKNLTSQNSAEADNGEFGIVPHLLTQSLHGIDELEDGEMSKRTKQIIENIDNANVDNQDLIFYIDEVDDASHTRRSRDILVPVIEHYIGQGKLFQVIPMSGTRIYRGEKILKDLPESDIVELAVEYYEMQLLQPETTCNRNFTRISFYSGAEDGLASISDAMKNKDSGHKSLGTIICKLLGTNNYEVEIDPDFPHIFIKFATVGKSNANKFVNYMNRNHAVIENREYHFQVINGDVTKSKEAQDYCKKVIEKNPGKTCVFITQGMATTSFSVKSIGTSIVFTDNELTADDIQALHRSATWDENKEECNMVVVTTNDSNEHTFDDIFEDETKQATTREERNSIYRELLNNNSMVHVTVNGDTIRPIKITEENVEQVLDKKAKQMTKTASIMNVLNDLDEEIKESIFESIAGKKSTSKRSKSTRGETFDPFGNTAKPKNQKRVSDTLSVAKQEKIMRAFVEGAVLVPALSREQQTDLEGFEYWNEVGIPKELFWDVYNSSWMFRDRVDTIYSLCEDEGYLINNYIDNLLV